MKVYNIENKRDLRLMLCEFRNTRNAKRRKRLQQIILRMLCGESNWLRKTGKPALFVA